MPAGHRDPVWKGKCSGSPHAPQPSSNIASQLSQHIGVRLELEKVKSLNVLRDLYELWRVSVELARRSNCPKQQGLPLALAEALT
jgi:hypothetical protein